MIYQEQQTANKHIQYEKLFAFSFSHILDFHSLNIYGMDCLAIGESFHLEWGNVFEADGENVKGKQKKFNIEILNENWSHVPQHC